jgi:hypothetical protein
LFVASAGESSNGLPGTVCCQPSFRCARVLEPLFPARESFLRAGLFRETRR